MRCFMFIKQFIVILILVSFTCAGCTNYSGNAYSGNEARSAQTVRYGTVVSVKNVAIEDSSGGALGAAGGGVVGGILGNMIGHGRGRTLATLAGALGGVGLGYAAGKAATNQNGLEITVRLDNGQEVSVVQGTDQMFAPGDKVRVLYGSNGSARVTR